MMTLFRTFKNKNKNYKARNLSLSVCHSQICRTVHTMSHISASNCTPKEVQF